MPTYVQDNKLWTIKLDPRVAAMKSSRSTWGLSSQVKSFRLQVTVDKFYLKRRHENISSHDLM